MVVFIDWKFDGFDDSDWTPAEELDIRPDVTFPVLTPFPVDAHPIWMEGQNNSRVFCRKQLQGRVSFSYHNTKLIALLIFNSFVISDEVCLYPSNPMNSTKMSVRLDNDGNVTVTYECRFNYVTPYNTTQFEFSCTEYYTQPDAYTFQDCNCKSPAP